MSEKSVHLMLTGRVQGVWFRGWMVQEAGARGLSGWVRNRNDGRVEAVLSGPADKVDDMLVACHKGPPAARVDDVQVEPASSPETKGFQAVPNA